MAETINRRCIEYSQQLEYLNFDSYDELVDNIDKYIEDNGLDYIYAAIIHDRDLDKEGMLVAPHCHVQFYSVSKLSREHLTAMTKDTKWNQFSYKDNKIQAFKYIIHETSNSYEKASYSVHEVRSNFDFEEFILKHSPNGKTIDDVVSKIINGTITFTDLTTDDSLAMLYTKHRSRFDNALSIASERKATSPKTNNVSTIWIHSEYSGIGKTMLAHKKAEEFIGDDKMSIYQSSANNDLFQDYKGQEVVIIDDLRPEDIALTDLLRLMDPNYTGSAKSRYNNKRITADLIIITTMLSPIKFFTRLVSDYSSEPVDQFLRRISYVCKLDKVNDKRYLSEAYVYKLHELDHLTNLDLDGNVIPKVYGNSEYVRTHYNLEYKKKR